MPPNSDAASRLMPRAFTRIACTAALVASAASSASADGQSVRASGASSVRYIELRPFIRDSVAQDTTTGTALLRQLADGRIVRCIPGDPFCRDTRPGAVVSTVPVMNDIDISVWGLGEGVRLYSQVRVRDAWGNGDAADLWPRSEDHVDLLASYAELERERLRVRLGRQFKVSGLGFYNFDGATVAVRPVGALWIEAFGGRSLIRGLNESRTSGALESIEPLAPVDAGILGGVQARYRPSPRLAISALYQVDFQRDRRSVYSELAMIDGVLRVRNTSVEGSLEADVMSGSLNQATLRIGAPPVRGTLFFGEVRRYRPYFEQWTIWGAFSPVGFDEQRAGATWSHARGRVIVRGEASHRNYNLPGVDEAADELRTDGWAVGSNVSWQAARQWRAEGSYRVETGFGAARRDMHAGVIRQFGDGGSVGVQAVLFERAYEFRLNEGAVAGLGAEAAVPLSPRLRFVGTASTYRHLDRSDTGIDWTQRRASMRLEWTVGSEPVIAPRAGAR
jgi:hypothetical protein